jgi:hypothetical protein
MIEPYDIGCEPSPSVPAEMLLQDGWQAYLLFWAVSKEPDPQSGWLKDLGVAVVECKNVVSTRFGYPNDEGLVEHPLYKLGLQDLTTSIAVTSKSEWLIDLIRQRQASLDRIRRNRVKNIRQSEVALLHFVVCLKELTFECVGTSLDVVHFAPDFEIATEYVMRKFRQH